ncbi:MAG TPA: cytochrome c biogenesis protein CcsA [Planctomycetota bacterium]|jgi:cytochrome c-type biogenesis protein CcsB|nr:cytochrome c biogenesis protein CcsA [Planctomycetota bacterium]
MNFAVFGALAGSARWSAIADILCLCGIAAVVVAGIANGRLALRGQRPSGPAAVLAHGPLALLIAALATMFCSIWQRGIEVHHFPSQTMSEVLNMFTTALLISMTVLHFALGLARRGPGWAILDDVLVGLVLGGVYGTHAYIRTLSTAQRDLPPALQSYWFPPHLSSLIFSYATMAIAALIALVFFVTRFWTGVFAGGVPKKKMAFSFVGLALIPFAQVVTLPVLAVSGLVFLVLWRLKRLPGPARLAALEKELDEVSFRAFAVGIPFLTAGVWMGAFWAQEAWANYWGWDSKENTALITWLVYVLYIHLRMLGGYRGSKAMAVLVGGALSVFMTFQIFGYLPDSQKSLHRYTDDNVVPSEGQQGNAPSTQARAEAPSEERTAAEMLPEGRKGG